MSSYVLVLNCGSSSLKCAVVEPETGDEPFKAVAERLGQFQGILTIQTAAGKQKTELQLSTHAEALALVVAALKQVDLADKIDAIGHRVVHGGEYFSESVMIDEDSRAKIADCIRLAPLHNPAHITGIDAASEAFPGLPQVAVFDTAFHQQMPERAYLYAIPYRLYEDEGIRRYGFHGTSFKYVSMQVPKLLGIDKPKMIICHLGNGGSLAAIDTDYSLDTTMGLTPFEGLVHGTRSGDIDPVLPRLLCEQFAMTTADMVTMLWKQSGLLGLSELSNDCRTLEAGMAQGHKGAARALEVYCYRLAKHIAGQMVALRGDVDALVFTGGIGENSSYVRKITIEQLGFLGFALDGRLNADTIGGKTGNIATEDSKPVLVIPTKEELLIARDTIRLAKEA